MNIFYLRRAIARIGEADLMRWWDSNALNPGGDIVIPRLFRRTPELSAAHMAILAARSRHDGNVPRERLVHLFNFGEAFEGAFERWLIQKKAEGWTPEPLTRVDENSANVEELLKKMEIEPATDVPNATGAAVAIGDVSAAELEEDGSVARLAGRLASAYVISQPERLIVPYFRVKD